MADRRDEAGEPTVIHPAPLDAGERQQADRAFVRGKRRPLAPFVDRPHAHANIVADFLLQGSQVFLFEGRDTL